MSESVDLAVFRAWLEAHSEPFVGIARDAWYCPLACWLSDVEQEPCTVSATKYGRVGRDESRALPTWAQRFARLVDTHYRYGRVPRVGALALLQHCLKGVL